MPRIIITDDMLTAKAVDRFWAKVRKTPGCWEWTATKGEGYGSFALKDLNGWVMVRAHVLSYRLRHGSLDYSLRLDHLCRNRACVNPDHLEQVTQRINILRGVGVAVGNTEKTHCPAGHAYAGRNLYVYANGDRRCRRCRADQEAERRARRGR
jgi:hypothetical protein